MARKRPARTGNPDLRQQKQIPMPPIEEIEQKIYTLLSPLSFKPLKMSENEQNKQFRDRILTLPVMMAIVIGLVYRQIPGLRELQRVLSEQGLLWVGQIEVSVQAVSKRLQKLPIELFAQIFEQVMARINVHWCQLKLQTLGSLVTSLRLVMPIMRLRLNSGVQEAEPLIPHSHAEHGSETTPTQSMGARQQINCRN